MRTHNTDKDHNNLLYTPAPANTVLATFYWKQKEVNHSFIDSQKFNCYQAAMSEDGGATFSTLHTNYNISSTLTDATARLDFVRANQKSVLNTASVCVYNLLAKGANSTDDNDQFDVDCNFVGTGSSSLSYK